MEVSLDQGQSWYPGELESDLRHPYAWTPWTYRWDASQPGDYEIWTKAKDSKGRMQPLQAYWNRKGYGNNAVYKMKVWVE